MSAFKSGKIKSPAELVKSTIKSLEKVEADASKKNLEELNKVLTTTKAVLFGPADGEPSQDLVAQLAQEIYTNNLLSQLIHALPVVDFESKKDIVTIFNKILKRSVGQRVPTVDEICKDKQHILFDLVQGYKNADVAMHHGMMLQECLKHEPLARIILFNDDAFNSFFDFVQQPTFDIASDAFASFKALLTNHKILCADFLEKNYDRVFQRYEELLKSENYVTRRQSLKLLGELLLDRANFTIMTKYISEPDNLKLMMNMLRDKSKNIQFEAFHVFKVFVANPNKTAPILDILKKNKAKLVEFLTKFHNDRAEDEQFSDEKDYLIKQIKEL